MRVGPDDLRTYHLTQISIVMKGDFVKIRIACRKSRPETNVLSFIHPTHQFKIDLDFEFEFECFFVGTPSDTVGMCVILDE